MSEVADGVAVCKIGLLITGLEDCTVGKVDDLVNDWLVLPIVDNDVGRVVVLVKGIGFSVAVSTDTTVAADVVVKLGVIEVKLLVTVVFWVY